MRKCHCPLLTNIDIDENQITDAEALVELKCPSEMDEFDLEWNDCPEMCCNVSWFAKMNITSMVHFRTLFAECSDSMSAKDKTKESLRPARKQNQRNQHCLLIKISLFF